MLMVISFPAIVEEWVALGSLATSSTALSIILLACALFVYAYNRVDLRTSKLPLQE